MDHIDFMEFVHPYLSERNDDCEGDWMSDNENELQTEEKELKREENLEAQQEEEQKKEKQWRKKLEREQKYAAHRKSQFVYEIKRIVQQHNKYIELLANWRAQILHAFQLSYTHNFYLFQHAQMIGDMHSLQEITMCMQEDARSAQEEIDQTRCVIHWHIIHVDFWMYQLQRVCDNQCFTI